MWAYKLLFRIYSLYITFFNDNNILSGEVTMIKKRNAFLAQIGLAAILAYVPQVNAISLLTMENNTYGDLAMQGNDDGSSNSLTNPFALNFFGNTYNNYFINNNGNITFDASVSGFTPNPFPTSNNPMIAPYWADVDTRCNTCGDVYVGAPNADTVIITWNNVGYFSSNSELTNDFQLVLRNRADDTGVSGDFDVEFRYNRLEWTTGDASEGSDGLGGTPAQSGYDAGDNINFFQLPGSRTADVTNLATTSNVSLSTPGLWSFAIRNGALPGETPENPILPVITDTGFAFDFNVELNERVFIDPVIAIGYDYEITSNNNFASVLLPNIGDDNYDLWLWNGTEYVDSNQNIAAGVEYFFSANGVDRFRIMGIETGALLDPNDPTAFVTGLTFTNSGQVIMTQSPVTYDTDQNTTSVPEPASIALLSLGLLGFAATRRKKKVSV